VKHYSGADKTNYKTNKHNTMSFQATGHIVQIKDAEQVSDKFTKREFAIKIDDGGKYDNFASFQAVQDRCSLLDNFAEGDEVTVHFDVRGREWQGRYFTNLQAWKIEAANNSMAEKADAISQPSGDPGKLMPEDVRRFTVLTRCVNCGEKKPPDDFYDNWRLPGGKSHECKQCTIERTNKNREKREKTIYQ
jgi:single-strand DNA-binding protein